MQGFTILAITYVEKTKLRVIVDGRTNERTYERTEIWTPISHPAISRCDKKEKQINKQASREGASQKERQINKQADKQTVESKYDTMVAHRNRNMRCLVISLLLI